MHRISIAIRAFFAALFDRTVAEQFQHVLEADSLPKIDESGENQLRPKPRAEATPPSRSEAVTLLAALQREARLLDLVKQPLGSFSDEEVGAAARHVLGDCGSVLDRFFALQPVSGVEEGSTCEIPIGYDPATYKLSGQVEGRGPFRGRLVHHGWKATHVKLPAWTGSRDGAVIVAPAEVEVSPPSTSPQP
jgi:hypothetical protein